MLKKTNLVLNQATISLLLTIGMSGTLFPACSKKSNPASIESRADGYYRASDYDKARVEYFNLLRAQPGSSIAMRRLGLIWMEHGAPMQAFPFLLKAKQLDASDVEVRRKLASVYLALGQRTEARREATEILALSPEDEDSLLLLAESAFTTEEKDDLQKTLLALPNPDSSPAHLARAAILFRGGNTAGAEAETEKAISLNAKSVRALLLRANLMATRKGVEAVRAAFKEAADLPPDHSIAKLRYAEFLLRSGAVAEGKAYLQAITAKTPDWLPAWDLLAQTAVAEKKPDEALAFCENIFARDPLNLNGRMLEAKSLLAKGDFKATIEKLERVNKTYPGTPAAECLLARAHMHAQQAAPAFAALARALAAQPGYGEAVLLQSELNLRVGDPRQAVAALEELAAKQPGNTEAQVLLAEAYRRVGKVEDTIGIYRKRLEAAPDNVPLLVLLGVALRGAKQFEEARAQFEKALQIAPATRTAIEQLIDLDLAEKKYADARKRIEPILVENPDSAGGNFLLARTYVAERNWAEAETAVQKALKADPNSVPAAELFAAICLAANKVPQAVAQLTALTAREPKLTAPYLTLALIYEKDGQYEKARAAYEKILAAEPDNASVLNNLAFLLLSDSHDTARGFEAAQRARTLRPNDPAVADTFGWALYLRRDFSQALAVLQEAAQKIGDQPVVQYHLGMAHYAMGQTEPARTALTKATAATEAFPGKEDAQRRLDLLSGGNLAHELSVEALEAMLQQQPEDVPVLLRAAQAYEQRKDYAKAESALQRALQQNSQMVPALAMLGRLYAGPLRDGTKALATAKRARELAPNDPNVAALFGKATYATGKSSWAYSLLQESARRLPDDRTVQYDLACAAYTCGKVAEAESILSKLALAGSPDTALAADAQTFLDLLAMERDRKNLPSVQSRIESTLAKDATFPPAQMAQAALYLEKREAAKAVAIYNGLLERLPEFAPAQMRLASIYADDPSRLKEAHALAVKARNALPEDPQAAVILARLSYLKKDFSQSRSLLQKAAENSPLDAPSLFYLGMSLLQEGKSTEAKAALEQALAAKLAEPMAVEARAALAAQ